jgi:hypothetical protein
MLEQIENALYAEDPKFASAVRGGRFRSATSRRRLQSAALFVVGLMLLIAGVALPVKPGGFPIISLLGFILMFGAGVLLLLGGAAVGAAQKAAASGSAAKGGRGKRRQASGFTARMEERFRRRFEQ